ncbi:hypothetical protein SAMD00019534_107680 [Acytostelium subglobosum LB1]|uniref:hypothetical protein n=1 Tax=Acytostelium subglobosum LB1 TaxID=1410327 RepID=UPI000644BEB3|nr:hypothetical protein SAMD00019534_107680 [Acytostelium subglobosum LB1]GAM27592.1 hypothetical protein SAMD00019534_107680 [Acytostelium subglobosum LB1]|eukprot:XP_012749251.1 hypothetical protein SAMD00019534_107680 [Acytostelium subglobosum LB1]
MLDFRQKTVEAIGVHGVTIEFMKTMNESEWDEVIPWVGPRGVVRSHIAASNIGAPKRKQFSDAEVMIMREEVKKIKFDDPVLSLPQDPHSHQIECDSISKTH